MGKTFGNTIAVTGMNNLAELLAAAGYTGINALSAFKAKTDDPAVALHLYLTEDGNHAPGVSQVETATIVGTITDTGLMEWIITADGMPGSPLTVSLEVEEEDTAAIVATKSVAALNANETLSEFFRSIEADGDDVVFTAWPAANDATMNAAYDDDTSAGLTGDATSTNTTAGNILPTSDGIEILDDVFEIGEGGQSVVIDAGLAWVVPDSGSLDVEFYAQEAGN